MELGATDSTGRRVGVVAVEPLMRDERKAPDLGVCAGKVEVRDLRKARHLISEAHCVSW